MRSPHSSQVPQRGTRAGRRTALVLGLSMALGAAALSTTGPATAATASPTSHPAPPLLSKIAEEAIATTLLKLPYNDTNLNQVSRLTTPNFIQHDARVGNGRAGLTSWISTYRKTYPAAKIRVWTILADGDTVAIHSQVTDQPGTLGNHVSDYYRFVGARVVEHWNAIEAIPATMTSGNDEFRTLSSPAHAVPDPRGDEAATRRVADYMLKNGTAAALINYGQDPYYQHTSAPVANGTAGILDVLKNQTPNLIQKDYKVVVDGDTFGLLSEFDFVPGVIPKDIVAGMFRVRDGRLVEHWETVEVEPTSSANTNGFF